MAAATVGHFSKVCSKPLEVTDLNVAPMTSVRVADVAGGTSLLHLRLDRDVFDWFKAGVEGHRTRMNAVPSADPRRSAETPEIP
jgi:uncharacterized protein (DUF4415 family)